MLEGLIHAEINGVTYTLRPGDSAHFPAGVTAVLHVPQRVRKSFALHEPGSAVRWWRKLL